MLRSDWAKLLLESFTIVSPGHKSLGLNFCARTRKQAIRTLYPIYILSSDWIIKGDIDVNMIMNI